MNMARRRRPVRLPRVFKARLDARQAAQLLRHAERRGLDPDAMFALLIKTIFTDDLIDAVIADGALADMTKPERRGHA
jgi:hypothetical protein